MLKWILPFVFLLLGILATIGLVKTGPEPERAPAEAIIPPVEFVVAEAAEHTLIVESEGTVEAAVQTVLLPEVSGRIVKVGPSFDAGRFFAPGEVLLEIDRLQYEGALAEARARLAAARLSLAREVAQGAQAA